MERVIIDRFANLNIADGGDRTIGLIELKACVIPLKITKFHYNCVSLIYVPFIIFFHYCLLGYNCHHRREFPALSMVG
jgi:hypothetical protein